MVGQCPCLSGSATVGQELGFPRRLHVATWEPSSGQQGLQLFWGLGAGKALASMTHAEQSSDPLQLGSVDRVAGLLPWWPFMPEAEYRVTESASR